MAFKNLLTAPDQIAYIQGAIIFRGCPQPPQDAERGFLVLGQVARVSRSREAVGGFLKSRRNTRAFCLPEAKIFRRCFMKEHEKGQDTTPKVSVKERLTADLRQIQLLSRMLILCSAFESFSLSATDVQCLCTWLLLFIGDVQKVLQEVK